jgi:membrane protease YdiL (CAAX protease family)
MQYRTAKGFSGPASLGILFALVGAGLILTGIAQFLIAFSFLPSGTGVDRMEEMLKKAIADPANVKFVIAMQAVGTLLLMFIPSGLFSLIVHGKGWHRLGLSRHFNYVQVGMAFLIIFAANFAAIPFDQLTRSCVSHFPSLYAKAIQMESDYATQVEILGSLRSVSGFFIGLFIIALLPAFFEEIFFRGVIQNLFTRWWGRPYIAILITSLFFSLVHGSIFLFISRAVLGIALGMIFYYTQNVWVSFIAHFINNGIAFTQLFFVSGKVSAMEEGTGNVLLDWAGAGIALVVSFFLFRFLKKTSHLFLPKIQEKENQPESSFINFQ